MDSGSIPDGSILKNIMKPTIQVYGIYENSGFDSTLIELFLIKDGVEFKLNKDEIKEMYDTLAGKKNKVFSHENDTDYNAKDIIVFNGDLKK